MLKWWHWAHLHSHWEIVSGFSREEHVDGFLGERLVARSRLPNFDDVKFAALWIANREAEKSGRLRVSLYFERRKSSRVP